MKLKFYLLVFVTVLAFNVKAQVTIGSLDAPHRGAVLDLKSDTLGFLPTRVDLVSLSDPEPLPVHVEGMIVYNKTVSEADTLQLGIYYNTGERWVRFSTEPFFTDNWFYMPSIAFDTSTLTPQGANLTKNLYAEFQKQFNEISNTNVVTSSGAPKPALSTIPAANELYYYVTAYDSDVFEIQSIDESGLMTYRIIAPATDKTFLNIVFVEK